MDREKDTDAFIRYLAEDISPVRPLRHPWLRTLAWLALAVPFVAALLLLASWRRNLALITPDLPLAIEQAAAFLTGVTAAAAAFGSVVPGYKPRFPLLPAVPLVVWLGSVGHGCVQDWLQFGANGLALYPDWVCVRVIAVQGSVPALAMVLMLRRGVPLTPRVTLALGGLAAAGLGYVGLSMVHAQEASVMVLVWQCGTVFALSTLAGLVGPLVMNRRTLLNGAGRALA